MRRLRLPAVLVTLLLGAAVLPAAFVAPATAAPAVAQPTPSSTPTPTPTGSGTHRVPPPAPSPTAHGKSPDAPDPHPPRGGIGPNGEAVGGTRLLDRGDVLPANAPALPHDLTARAFVLADLDTGDIVAARDPHGRYPAASIQKLLTSVTLAPLLPGDRTVTVSHRAANTEGSHAGLVGGGKYTIDEIFRGLLLVSGNDAAEALAEAAGGRTTTVAAMNAEALRLGAYDTFVQTPSGLDGWQQLTSAYDMTVFLRAAANQPRLLAYDTVDTATLPAQPAAHAHKITLYNQNTQFLHTVKGALLAKTGFTDAAQHTFAGVIRRGGHRYGVVLMRAQRYPDDQWVQATKLVNWARALPPGTAPVGVLAAPVGAGTQGGAAPAAVQRSAVAAASTPASTSATPSAGTSPSAPAKSSGNSGGRLVVVIVVLGVIVLLIQWIRRAAHPRRPGDEQYRMFPYRARGPSRRPPPRRPPGRQQRPPRGGPPPEPPTDSDGPNGPSDGPDLRKPPPAE